jgi:PAS domain S-box-containing protein
MNRILRGLIPPTVLLALLILGLAASVLRLRGSLQDLSRAHANRSATLALAAELRQSSDDLTRMARTYAVTRDPRYKAYYHRILAIRDGRAPRPRNYDHSYWDFVTSAHHYPETPDGPAIALVERMRQAGFTPAELDLLRQSKDRSDVLVGLEEQAFAAVEGRTPGGRPDPELALRLLHGEAYHLAKAAIMEPIDRFLGSIERRTHQETQAAQARASRQFWLTVALLTLVAAMVLILAVLEYKLSGAMVQALELQVATRVQRLQQSESRLQESETFLSALATALPGMVGYWDQDLRCRFANRAYQDYFGRSPEQMLGITIQELLGEQLFRMNEPHIRAALAGEAQHYQRALRKVDGTQSHNWAQYIPDWDGDRVRGFVVLVSDITELKEAENALTQAKEAAEAANRAKGEFLANMSHEIRTPMNGIIGLSGLALGLELAPKLRSYLGKIHTSARALLSIINDILDFSKVEAGRLELDATEFNLERLLDDVASLFALSAEEKGVELAVELQPGVPRQLIGDPMRLAQVLTNLVGNAVKFTSAGLVHIKVAALETGAGHALLRFEVRDTGIGISPEDQDKLFQAFTQADGSITRRFGGTGLGLAIGQRLVNLMGGEIRVESRLGVGSRFHFELRCAAPAAPEARPEASLRELRVLLVDDQPTSRHILGEILRSWGCQVLEAADASAALAEVTRAGPPGQAFDLLLADWKMPGMDGLELARELRRQTGLGRVPHLPIIILVTAFGRDELAREAGDLHLDGILAKPVSASTLADSILRTLGQLGPAAEPKAPAIAPAALGGARILLVEDNLTNQLVACDLLEQAGLRVTVAGDGRQALAALAEATFDAVLMDVQMPEMDGLEATRRIRQDPRLLSLPVIAMTAGVLPQDQERCLAAGMNDHVAKPIEPGTLFATLGRWLAGRETGLGGALAPGGAPEARVLAALARDLATQLSLLREALRAEDALLAGRTAHSLKGMVLMAPAPGVREAARALEEALARGDGWMTAGRGLEALLEPLARASAPGPAAPGPAAPGPAAPGPAAPGPAAPESAAPASVQSDPTNVPRAVPDLAQAASLLVNLDQKLRRKSLGARQEVEALRALLGPEEHVLGLQACMRELDFQRAAGLLAELAETLGLPSARI